MTPNSCFNKMEDDFMPILDDTKIEPELDRGHLQTIKALAEESECSVEKVNTIYASALQSLRSSARIQDYLHVLASKKVRDALRH